MEMTPATKLLHGTTRKLFGIAATLDPDKTYSSIGYPTKNELGQSFKNYVVDLARDQTILPTGTTAYDEHNDNTASELLATAAHDTFNVFQRSVFELHPELSLESLKDIVNHPLTTLAIAEIALRGSTSLNGVIHHSKQNSNFLLDDDKKYLVRRGALEPSSKGGCPFAGREGIVAPAPIFAKVSPVLGLLAINCHITHFK